MEWDMVETFDAADESTMSCKSFAPCEDDEQTNHILLADWQKSRRKTFLRHSHAVGCSSAARGHGDATLNH